MTVDAEPKAGQAPERGKPLKLLAWLLALTALIGASERINRPQIEANAQRHRIALLETLTPTGNDDERAFAKRRTLPGHPLLGNEERETTLLPLERNGRHYGTILLPVHVRGYRGRMALMVGFDREGNKLLGARLMQHRETPGIGDAADLEKSDWIRQFDGANLDSTWRLRGDGGAFDAISGATVTSRAVLRGIERAAQYHHSRLAELYREDRESAAPAP